MSDDPYAERRKLTFAQAEGAAPLPQQLQLKEVSQEMRARLWGLIYKSTGLEHLELSLVWRKILSDHYQNVQHKMIDDLAQNPRILLVWLKGIFEQGNYVEIFDFIQYVLRHPDHPPNFHYSVETILRDTQAAYRILDAKTIVPISSEAEFETLKKSFVDLAAKEFCGARKHLRDAASLATTGDYAGSIRESVHAVESVARTIAPSKSLLESLKAIEKKTPIHSGLKAGFNSIYGYTSDEQGIRHSLIDGPAAAVDETDALFMIGACAAFVSYLINKARTAGLLSKRA